MSEDTAVESALDNDLERFLELPVYNDSEETALPIRKVEPKAYKELNFIKPISANELIKTDYGKLDFLITNILPTGLTFLAGRPKTGKSWLALQIAVAVGSGGTILGEKANNHSVLYIAYEDNTRRLHERLIKQGVTEELGKAIDVYPGDVAQENFDNLFENKGEKITQLADIYGLIIIDTFSRAVHGKYNDNDAMARVLSPIHRIALDRDISILIIDHTRKSKQFRPNNAIEDLMGGTAKAGIPDTVLGLYEFQKSYYLEVSSREIEGRLRKVYLDPETFTWQLADGEEKSTLTETGNLGELQALILDALHKLGKATAKQISDYINKDKSNVSKVLLKLIDKEYVGRDPVGDNLFIYYAKI